MSDVTLSDGVTREPRGWERTDGCTCETIVDDEHEPRCPYPIIETRRALWWRWNMISNLRGPYNCSSAVEAVLRDQGWSVTGEYGWTATSKTAREWLDAIEVEIRGLLAEIEEVRAELPMLCLVCRRPLDDAQRSTARYCSNRCRQAAHRARNA